MKTLFIPLMAIALLTACSTAPDNAEQNEEAESMVDDHAGHDHDSEMSGASMPAAPDGASVYFANLKDGDVVPAKVFVEFGVKGIELEPAGEVQKGFGHHHIIIDDAATPMGEAVPADATHIHYGGGQTGDTLNLAPGIHTLVLQFADGMHRSYGEALSAKIQVKVLN